MDSDLWSCLLLSAEESKNFFGILLPTISSLSLPFVDKKRGVMSEMGKTGHFSKYIYFLLTMHTFTTGQDFLMILIHSYWLKSV